MRIRHIAFSFAAAAFLFASCTQNVDVLIIGGGASGTAAGLQASRMGAKTLIVEETPWLGGMLTSAGVSAIDGNYRLRGGIFGEFTDSLASHYGGYDKLQSGWVSSILFEPHVGAEIFDALTGKESNLSVRRETRFEEIKKLPKGWRVTFDKGPSVKCKVLIDGTELGDVAKACGVAYHIGFDPKSYTGEEMAFEEGNDIIQDMTMVMTIKDFGPDADMSIECPEGYRREEYLNCCENPLNDPAYDKGQAFWSDWMMLSYGRLPGGKMMINWPIAGNDYYANIIDMSREQRDSVIQKARLHALGFLYFIQSELGYKNLGLATDEYPSGDGIAMIPYHRESRRIEGEHLFTLEEARERYISNAYRTGIAVGDYPVDHHHFAHPEWSKLPKMIFAPIPSFTLPAGTLVPLEVEDLIVAEKSISVTNLINGSTRLQPVVVEIGQAAGALAALSLRNDCKIREVGVRTLQNALLESGAYLQPWLDLKPGDEGFKSLQKIGCTGILRGEGRNIDWSNESWMRADEPLRWNELYLEEYYGIPYNDSSKPVSAGQFAELLSSLSGTDVTLNLPEDSHISRLDAAIAIDGILNPFAREVNFTGDLKD